jgi:hypothetical protein
MEPFCHERIRLFGAYAFNLERRAHVDRPGVGLSRRPTLVPGCVNWRMSLRHPHSHGRDDTRHVSSRCRTVYAHRDAVIMSVIPACEAVIQFRISHLCALCSSFPRKREPRDFSRLPPGSPLTRGRRIVCPQDFPDSRLRGDDGRAEVRYANFCNEVLVHRFIQLMQLDVPSALSRRRPGSTFAVGTGFRRCSGFETSDRASLPDESCE